MISQGQKRSSQLSRVIRTRTCHFTRASLASQGQKHVTFSVPHSFHMDMSLSLLLLTRVTGTKTLSSLIHVTGTKQVTFLALDFV